MNTQLDTFTRSYIETALWSSTGGKYGECPCCGKVAVLDRWPEEEFEQEEVCYECGPREMNWEPPLDRNYSVTDLAPETLARMEADCRDFQSSFGEYIASDLSRAGHDFWLTRNRHGAGFWDGDWNEPFLTGIMLDGCQLLGTSLKLSKGEKVFLRPASNQPDKSRYFASPLNVREDFPAGNSILVQASEVELPYVPQYQTVGDYLAARSYAYGSADLYVGDDGRIYQY